MSLTKIIVRFLLIGYLAIHGACLSGAVKKPAPTPNSKELLFLIIHGTEAAEQPWYQKGGDFYSAVEKSITFLTQQNPTIKVKMLGFGWSGGKSCASREDGGQKLANFIEIFPENTEIHIIAHSHGTSIVHRASHILAERKMNHKIAVLYGMGTPIDMETYPPNMDVIGHIYNLFSFYDPVQTVWGTHDREYPDHPRIVNIRAVVCKKHPGHSSIHDPIVGLWLPLLHNYIYKPSTLKHGYANTFNAPIVMYFDEALHSPIYEVDVLRNAWRAMDTEFELRYWRYYVRKAVTNPPSLPFNPFKWTPQAVRNFLHHHYARIITAAKKFMDYERLSVQEKLDTIHNRLTDIISGNVVAG
jgi:hypothetical protein